MSGFVVDSIDAARHMLHWLAKRRRTSLSGLVKAANLTSASLVNFASLDAAGKRTRDANTGPLLQLLVKHDHRLVARPARSQHPVLRVPGATPVQLRGADGELLEVHLDDLEGVRTLGRTIAVVKHQSLTAVCERAGLSNAMPQFILAAAATTQGDLRLSRVIELTHAGGFELTVKQIYANRSEARLAEKRAAGRAPEPVPA